MGGILRSNLDPTQVGAWSMEFAGQPRTSDSRSIPSTPGYDISCTRLFIGLPSLGGLGPRWDVGMLLFLAFTTHKGVSKRMMNYGMAPSNTFHHMIVHMTRWTQEEIEISNDNAMDS